MSVEELRERIQSEVARRIERHLGELRKEFDLLREETDRRWRDFLARFERQVPDLIPAGLIPEPSPPPPPSPTAAEFSEFHRLSRALDASANQVDTLKAFLAECAQKASRCILFVTKGDSLVVWKAEGFSGADEARIRSASLAPAAHPSIAAALAGTPGRLPASNPVAAALGLAGAAESVVLPVVVHEKISAVLYADRTGGGSRLDAEALGVLCFLVGVSVDRLSPKKISPAPALRPLRAWEEADVTSAPSLDVEVLEPGPASAEAEPKPEEKVEEEPPPPRISAVPAAARETPESARETPLAPKRVDLEGTGKPYRPPTGVAPAGPRVLRGPLAVDDEDPHDHARRLARLLVSDIKLYNESAIAEGRKHNDLYLRLKEDIDRARQTYNERVPAAVRQNTNYFQEELVRTIADGRPDALGA
jgi:hypothetical protein